MKDSETCSGARWRSRRTSPPRAPTSRWCSAGPGRPAEALALARRRVRGRARAIGHMNLKAATLGRLGDFEKAIELYEAVLQQVAAPAEGVAQLRPHAEDRRAAGRRHCTPIARRSSSSRTLGEAWWSLANLKTVRFDDADIAAMQARSRRPSSTTTTGSISNSRSARRCTTPAARDEAFDHYAAGNALRREIPSIPTRSEITRTRRSEHRSRSPPRCLTRSRAGAKRPTRSSSSACRAPDRPWSSRSCRRTARSKEPSELPDIPALARGERQVSGRCWLDDRRANAARLGEEYLKRTSVQRRTDRPFFIDKLPNNWMFVPFIQLVLPNAKIIDARRHPLGCCFSNFRQHFARGQDFTYDLERPWPLLFRLCAADGACRRRAAGPGPPRASMSGWSTTPRPRCARCSTIAGWSSSRRAWTSTRPSARSGPPAPSRSGADLPRRDRGMASLRAVSWHR